MRTYPGSGSATIERMTSSEWGQLRAVRLQALLAEPDAFGTARTQDLRWSTTDWQDTLRTNVWLRASTPDGRLEGVVAFFPTDTDPDGAPQMGSMWVKPTARGRGLGRRLCRAVAEIAGADGAPMLGLWVVDGNHTATEVYRRLGFRESPHRKPAPRDHDVLMRRMVLPL